MRILLLDIETAPNVAYVWNLYKEYSIPLQRLIKPSRMICWASKWYKKGGIEFASEWGDGRDVMLLKLHGLLQEADAVVTYNGDKFDLPRIMGEFIQLGFDHPGPLTSIDLYKTVRRLGLPSGKLEYVAEALGIGSKLKHEGFEMWRGIEDGNPASQKHMEKYNKHDTRLLEKAYTALRPYIKNHPFLGSTKPNRCPACGSGKVQRRGTRRTKAFIIERIHCQKCGSWGDGSRSKVV